MKLSPLDINRLLGRVPDRKRDIERIKYYLDDYESQVKAESARHESEEKKLRLLLQQIQSGCPHLETTFYGDAAGGSDSHTSCDLCGKEIRGNNRLNKERT